MFKKRTVNGSFSGIGQGILKNCTLTNYKVWRGEFEVNNGRVRKIILRKYYFKATADRSFRRCQRWDDLLNVVNRSFVFRLGRSGFLAQTRAQALFLNMFINNYVKIWLW